MNPDQILKEQIKAWSVATTGAFLLTQKLHRRPVEAEILMYCKDGGLSKGYMKLIYGLSVHAQHVLNSFRKLEPGVLDMKYFKKG